MRKSNPLTLSCLWPRQKPTASGSLNPVPRTSHVHERWYVMKRTHCIALAVLALGVLAAAPGVQAQTKKISYAITELPALPGNDSFAFGHQQLRGGRRQFIWV